MKLRTIHSIIFDENSHCYLDKNFNELKGVTKLMKEQGLSPDYTGIPQDVLDKAAARGTAVHKALEAFDNGEPVEETAELKEYRKLGLNVIASEYLVTDRVRVASMIDKVVFVDEGTVDLADIKTTSTLHKNSVSWQLSIYKYLFERINKGIKVRNLYAVHVRDGKARIVLVREVPEKEIAALLRADAKGEKYTPSWKAVDFVVKEDAKVALYIDRASKIAELKKAIKLLEEANMKLTTELVEFMEKEHMDSIETDNGDIVYKASYERASVDSKTLKEKYPEIYAECLKSTTVKASVSFKPKES